VPQLPALVALAAALVLVSDANWFFLRPGPAVLNDMDEGYAQAIARRMIEGRWLPYVDGVSHRGPVFYWVAAIGARVFGSESWLSMRVLAWLMLVSTLTLGFTTAVLLKRWLAGGIMALGYVAICLGSMSAHDGLAMNAEHVLNVFVLAALPCLIVGLRRASSPRALAWLAVAGALTMLGGLAKQVGLAALGPFGLWVICAAIARGELSRRRRVGLVVAFAVGALAPLAVVLARYVVAGELATFAYYFYTYNTRIYVGGVGEHAKSLFDLFWTRKFDLLVIAAPLLGFALFHGIAGARRLRDVPRAFDARGAEATVMLQAVVALAISNGGRRDFGHYYLQVLPWAGLFGGLVVERLLEQSAYRERVHWLRATLGRSLIVLPAVAIAIAGWTVRVRQYQQRGHGGFKSANWPICKFVQEKSKPSDSIFLWGFDPAPYTACKRRPASRYVYTTFPSGYIPFLSRTPEVEAQQVAPGSQEILLRELEQSRPALIFDSARSMGGRSIMQYERLASFVKAGYCRADVNVGGPTPWVQKSGNDCPSR
jgi:4-amino-4-deoxy-L-arabinose transferase-like glycosyltransferase